MAKRKPASFEEKWFDGKKTRQTIVRLEPIYKLILKAAKASRTI